MAGEQAEDEEEGTVVTAGGVRREVHMSGGARGVGAGRLEVMNAYSVTVALRPVLPAALVRLTDRQTNRLTDRYRSTRDEALAVSSVIAPY